MDKVKWLSFNDETLQRAKVENKPIYLFVANKDSYLTEDMESHSFCDEEILNMLKDDFIAIKVDRGDFPNLENISITINQVMNNSVGEPLNIFLTPDLKPFFSASFMPLKGSPQRPGMKDCLPRIKWLWLMKNDSVIKASEDILKVIKDSSKILPVSYDVKIEDTVDLIESQIDTKYGGFSEGTKFPSVHKLLMLLSYVKRKGRKSVLEGVTKTLDSMADGAIRDHLSGGFFQYTRDRRWRFPDFSKTINGQATMALLYAEAFKITQNPYYWRIADETISYSLLNLYHRGRGFCFRQMPKISTPYGKYFLWSEKDIDEVLGIDSKIFKKAYGITKRGNYNDIFSDKKVGLNSLFIAKDLKTLVFNSGFSDLEELQDSLAKDRQKLSSFRSEREGLISDDRIFTDSNGAMIASLARCGRLMDRSIYIDKAIECAETFLSMDHIKHVDGVDPFLDDYAYMIWGLWEIYLATEDARWKDRAISFLERAVELFGASDGGFFYSSKDGDGVLFRRKEVYDGLLPSGNSVMINNLVSMWKVLDQDKYIDMAKDCLKSIAGVVSARPDSYPFVITAMIRLTL